ncbi:uncharacterized protein LOC107045577 [Diachasma alloeum]|uniref:uncharacterized protein LOC107045577 n=1 Tax=Diachasma alloeum TaxID=454923 RepID=UPI000738115D|nr:uncharacterized protein LOC107045577 [Diachasma alloeum]
MLQLDHAGTHLWSDSAVTLAWIRSHASRWKDFIHNRVVKIQETLTNATWRHDPEEWPQSRIDAPAMDIPEVAKEAKPARAHPVAPKVNELAELLTRYSSMARLLAVTATSNRAIDRFRRLPTPPGPVLSTRELNEARLFWVKITQNQYFVSALRVLQRNQQLPRGHQLAKLTPTLDELNIMRLGGRLKNSDLHPEETHPIILPRQSRFTTLVIEEAHRRTLHGGTQLTLAYTRQRYWIIGGRGTVRAYILRCAICTRHRGKQGQQQMGQLPATRVSSSRAFLHTRVDYAGPFQILKWRPTNAQPGQVHIAVFVCCTTLAVHLELVNRQITGAFLGAYKRFTGRRGIPAVMYSHNATTFTSAAEVLERLYHQASRENQRIQAALATNGTQWSFSPPRAPHFGGKWEAAVKSTKYHLKRVLGKTTLTFEELNTIVIQIEACLNSRPICPMSDDPEDLQVLTPGHFLIGEPLQVIPESSYVNENSSKIRRWNLVTQIIHQLWSRWSKECLQRYQSIFKWKTRQQNIEVGNMVLMMEDGFPPTQWPIARVIATKPGADGLTRVAKVRITKVEVGTHPDGSPKLQNIKTTHSEFDRPIAKLCLLPTDPPPPE